MGKTNLQRKKTEGTSKNANFLRKVQAMVSFSNENSIINIFLIVLALFLIVTGVHLILGGCSYSGVKGFCGDVKDIRAWATLILGVCLLYFLYKNNSS